MKESEKKDSKYRAPNPAFMKAMKPSEALAKIVGNEPLPRTVITKKLWEYIKKITFRMQRTREISMQMRISWLYSTGTNRSQCLR